MVALSCPLCQYNLDTAQESIMKERYGFQKLPIVYFSQLLAIALGLDSSKYVLEREHFPRFSIGESLLPQCMAFLEEAELVDAVEAAAFQFKNGAAFCCGEAYDTFDFGEKFTPGWSTTFQVQR